MNNQHLQTQLLRLKFDAPVERAFQADYFPQTLLQARLVLLIGTLFLTVFGSILDLVAAADRLAQLWPVRYGLGLPMFVVTFGMTFWPRMRVYLQPVMTVIICLAGLLITTLSLIVPMKISYLYFGGITALLVLTYTLSRLRFSYAVLACWFVTLAHVGITIYRSGFTPLVLTYLPVLISVNITGGIACYMVEYYNRRDFFHRQQLAQEQAKSESLLLNILPPSIADRLKQQNGIIADSYNEVSILFADIVGFTTLASQTSPTELVDLLNRVFSLFDQLTEQYGLEKIKTIGDAYMVVSGIPIPRPDHAEAIAEMALGMRLALKQFNAENNQQFQIRIGINTGPVVAGVIGIKKFIYDLWGDTVNIASRMESQGLVNEIQVTEATYTRLQHQYTFQKRGYIEVKGRGEMLTYILLGRMQERE